MRRSCAAVRVGCGAFVVGVPSALGYGVFSELLLTPVPLLDIIQHFASNIVLPLSGIAITLFAGWVWQMDAMLASGLVTRWQRQFWIWL